MGTPTEAGFASILWGEAPKSKNSTANHERWRVSWRGETWGHPNQVRRVAQWVKDEPLI